MMWLAVDSGSSRVKWALVKDGRLLSVGDSAKNHLQRLTTVSKRAYCARVSCVGGAKRQEVLRAALSPCKKVFFLRARAQAAGVINRYRPPSSLGVDRWLGLIAARALVRDIIIVDAGTATTIDALSASGDFLGGVILPGETLMKNALKRILPAGNKRTSPAWPSLCTHSATVAGASLAAVGAALRMRRLLLPGAKILLSGGGGERLLSWLPTGQLRQHLVIEGIVRLARE